MARSSRRSRRNRGGGCAVSLLNVLTAMLVVAAFFIALAVILAFVLPGGTLAAMLGLQGPSLTPTLAQLAVVPTLPPSATPEVVRATFTPIPSQTSGPLAPTNTRRPTLTPSITPTFPPFTPTRTPSPTPTHTPTPGPSPTATNTRSPFPFTKSPDSPIPLANYANNAGCNWLGIAGEVFDLNGNPVGSSTYQVHVWDSGVDVRAPVGGATAYGPSGYEVYLFDAPRVQSHNVQLETVNGTAVSQIYRVTTWASCNQNLLYFVFLQNH